jgi:DNA-binding CsgD family transcriptional regulator
MRAVATHWGELPRREQEVLLMRFRGDMTQAQIGQRLCISQMQVSRLIARALGYLRSQLLDLEVTHPGVGPAVAPPPGNMNLRPMLPGQAADPGDRP